MKHKLTLVLCLVSLVALFAPAAEAQNRIRQSSEYQNYQYGQRYGGRYGQRGGSSTFERCGGYYDPYTGICDPQSPDRGHRQATRNDVRGWTIGMGAANLLATLWDGHKTRSEFKKGAQIDLEILANQRELLARNQPDVRIQQDQRVDVRDMDERPTRPYLRHKYGVSHTSFTYENTTQCVVALFNQRLHQEQALRPGETKTMRWNPRDVEATAFINGQFQELELDVQGSNVVIVDPSES